MGRLFGTDGVRGVANSDLTADLAYKLGLAGTYVLAKQNARPTILIAKDTRVSGDMLEDAISAGILSMGGNVIKAGILPTPAVAYLVKDMKIDAGVVISASHNPFQDNGIKFFNANGFKLDDKIEDEIESVIMRYVDVNSHITGDKLGRCIEDEGDALRRYAEFLESTVDVRLEGFKVALDCANGASYKVASRVFRAMGASVVTLFDEPDGLNINDHCGSTHPKALQQFVLSVEADLGLAFDGDADRLIAVDENGQIVDGDKVMYICARMLKEENKLPQNKVTATVMSNMGFFKALEKLGCQAETTKVGDRYVLESMLKTGSVLGGEQSGHIIFLNHATTGDGILAGLQLMSALKKSGKSLSELAGEVEIYPQVLRNARIKNENKSSYMEDEEVKQMVEAVEDAMAGEGRVLIRPSGTEALVRVMIEGKDQEEITKMAEELAELITRKLG